MDGDENVLPDLPHQEITCESARRRAKNRIFRTLLGLLTPVLLAIGLLAAVEGGLRAAGYGQSTRPFLKRSCGGAPVYVRNKAFLEQFFSEPIHQFIWEWPQFSVPMPKAKGVYRIFVFGSSAAMGWPGYEFAFPRLLEAMLEAAYPDTRFEVYNMAFSGVNSHVMRATAQACARLEPDLFLVYMGNNEIRGPFGLVTGMSVSPAIPPRAMIQAAIACSDLRLVQLLRQWRGPAPALPEINPIQAPHPDDPRLAAVYENYRENLDDLCSMGTRGGARVLLSSVAVNLRDWSPSTSWNRAGLDSFSLGTWWSKYRDGMKLQGEKKFPEALRLYQEAEGIDDSYAELQYRIAQCLYEAGEFDAARNRFVRALDLDSFEWVRAKSPINQIVHATAEARSKDGVGFVDGDQALADRSPRGIPGIELFVDSCHPNLEGSYGLASAFFSEMVKILPDSIAAAKQPAPPILSLDECRRRLVLTPDKLLEPYRQVMKMSEELGRSPVDALRQQMAAIECESPPDASEQVMVALEDALRIRPGDYYLHYEYAQRLIYRDSLDEAVQQGIRLVDQHPCRRGSHRVLAEALLRSAQYEKAIDTLAQIVSVYANDSECNALWGDALRRLTRYDEALQRYDLALADDKNNPRARCGRIDIAVRQGKESEPVSRYMEVIDRSPWFYEAFEYIADIFQQNGDLDGLAALWKSVTVRHPESSLAFHWFGLALEKKEDLEGAIEAFRSAHRLDPLRWVTTSGLSRVLVRQARLFQQANRLEDAEKAFHEARSYSPRNADAWAGEIAALCAREDWIGASEAYGAARKAVAETDLELPAEYADRLKAME